MFIDRAILAAIICTFACTGMAMGSTLVASGTVQLGSSQYDYKTWDTTNDISMGFTWRFGGIPRGMTFRENRLYVVNGCDLRDGPGYYYEPSFGGGLGPATRMGRSNFVSQSGIQTHAVTFNTSGQGFGYSSPNNTGYVGMSDLNPHVVYSASPSSGSDWTVTPPVALPGVPDFIASRDLDYIPSLDQFASLAFVGVNPTVSFRPHTATGIGAASSGFDLPFRASTIQPISAAFASRLLGIPVPDQTLLLAVGNPVWPTNLIEIGVFALDGTPLAPTQQIASLDVHGVTSIAVDEATGTIYLGGRYFVSEFDEGGRIAVISVPSVSTITIGLLGGLGLARRRRG